MTGQTELNQKGDQQSGNLTPSFGSIGASSGKISDEFACRLAALPPSHQVRAVVLPAPYLVNGSNGARVRGEERQAILREARTRTEETFTEIDQVLAGTGGQRLTASGNALGFIVVETTANGIAAIANLGWVGTVMEDQAIRPVHQAESAITL